MSTDVNLYSFNGPEWNNMKWGSPLDVYPHPGDNVPPGWQDTLKFSTGLTDFELTADSVKGGTEDCADFNNECINVKLKVGLFSSGGKYVTTVKGGCAGIDIRGCILRGGSEVDHDLGNHSDQSSQKTTGVTLGTWKADGSPVTIRCLIADKPTLVEGTGPYEYVFPHPDSFLHPMWVWLFVTSRRLGLWK